jgi:hypothetical protein
MRNSQCEPWGLKCENICEGAPSGLQPPLNPRLLFVTQFDRQRSLPEDLGLLCRRQLRVNRHTESPWYRALQRVPAKILHAFLRGACHDAPKIIVFHILALNDL